MKFENLVQSGGEAKYMIAQGGVRVNGAIETRKRKKTDANIGEALASRKLSAHLRDLGIVRGGPTPFQPRDRSRFLQRLDAIVQSIGRQDKDGS